MPELAEVEYYRKQWDPGIGSRVVRVHLHREKRVFRGTDTDLLLERLAGRTLRSSEASGKQMLFRFTGDCWLGVHLGMTGKMSTERVDFAPGRHDHLVLFQARRALVFNDMRQFGRVQFAHGAEAPDWWAKLPPGPAGDGFTPQWVNDFLQRHGRLPVKAVLLHQAGFPGIGNWMADEILWRARIAPQRRVETLTMAERDRLFRQTRFVARGALEHIGSDFGDPPRGWLFHERWGRKGVCPRHKTFLRRETVGGRTTAWCPECQG